MIEPFEAAVESIAAFVSIAIFSNIFYYAALITLYVLGSLGMYTIAKRRELNNAWMAWVPGLSLWLLGSISDQYQYVTKDKVCNRRKWLIVLAIAMIVLFIAMYVCMFVAYFQIIFDAAMNSDMEYMDELQILEMIFKSFMPTFIVLAVYVVVGMVVTVLEYICYYHLFASCDPENKVLFLVLGIFMNFLLPIFTFVCRKKDLGMPPRRNVPPAAILQPAYQPAQPYEPWTQPTVQNPNK